PSSPDSGGVVMEILQHAHELAERRERREISAEEVTQAYLDRMERLEPHVHAFLARTPEQALATAREVDRRRAQGEPVHPLAGIPVAVKDNLCTEGVPTTARGSPPGRSEEHTSELQSRENLVCRLLLEKKKKQQTQR